MPSRFNPSFLIAAMVLAGNGIGLAQPFAIQVVDEGNQRGIPMVTVETDNHIRMVTDSSGWVIFDEPGLMGRSVHVEVSSPGYQLPRDSDGRSGTVLNIQPGQGTEIKMVRTAVAERFYRITGQGSYRDSTLLSKDTPTPFPNINGDVISVGTAQTATYQGKMVWVWSSAHLTTPPSPALVVGAAVDLPGNGGLDPTQGIHCRHFTGEQDETLPLLAAGKGKHAVLGGLMTVLDSMGAEHLLTHYTFLDADEKPTEHGIAELNARHQFERKIVLGDEYTWQFPQGQAVTVKGAEGAYVYFAHPFCLTRVVASYEAATSPTSYEALTWSDEDKKFVWQQARGPTSAAEEARLMDKGRLRRKDARTQITAAITGESLPVAEGSVQWNAFRKRWILICTAASNDKNPGDVWYAEASNVDGPWSHAVQVAAHGSYDFKCVMQLPALAQDNERHIYFAGTLAGGNCPVPRYQDNQLLYRLDLDDPRLALEK